ncbi:LPG2 / GDP-Man transporter [Leishmania donovani]|uniref:LPG2 n=1 Tax=Leishmania donovani TaxID=5661 RepID=Q25266_LEIDO|nr:LPG2 [Leishmania donovani]CAJ1992672.1 LPG2 / GDP-Man transporter [Leishmania donovani]VDZ48504.1 lipophosphoglycan_biosynthetic_protein_(lpg2)/GeneDB:LmjF.34.3120 [Leishmania donovani]prf//2120442A LPG2 gene [Leishmania donovani]
MNHTRSVMEAVLAVITYSFCSVSMILVNKLIMNTYDMNFPFGILVLQTGGALVIVALAKAARFIEYPAFSFDVAKKWLPLTLLFVAMLFTSMKSLGTMSVAAQTILKNLAVVLIALGDKFLYGKAQTPMVYFSFALMILGSLLGAKGDKWVTAWGLVWTFLNIVSTVSYTLYMKAVLGSVSNSIGRYGPVFYNNLLSLPFFLIMGVGDIMPFSAAIGDTTTFGKLVLTFSVLVSSVMTFSVFWCMSITSPTTMSVVGSLNKIPLTFLGMLVFHQFPTATGYLGIMIALSAGFLYTHLNIRANRAKASSDTEHQMQQAGKTTAESIVLVRADENSNDTSKSE